METTQSPYAEIDGAIERWVQRKRLSLCREWEGEARFWYTSHGDECFQIAVDRPAEGFVTVRAFSIETDDDAELRGEWTVTLDRLEQALAVATKLVDLWARRDRVAR